MRSGIVLILSLFAAIICIKFSQGLGLERPNRIPFGPPIKWALYDIGRVLLGFFIGFSIARLLSVEKDIKTLKDAQEDDKPWHEGLPQDQGDLDDPVDTYPITGRRRSG